MASGASYEGDPDFVYLAYDKKKLMEEQCMPYDGKKNCWVDDKKDGYVKAEIESTKGDDVNVVCTDTREVSGLFKSRGFNSNFTKCVLYACVLG